VSLFFAVNQVEFGLIPRKGERRAYMREEDLFDGSFIAGFCSYHQEIMLLSDYEWKGCWICWLHFGKNVDFSFLTVKEAARKYKVGRKTIYR
jgi:hypothetical protein